MKFIQIYPVFTEEFFVEKEHWNFVSKFVIICFSSIIFNVNYFKLNMFKIRRELVQGLVTELAVLLSEQGQDGLGVVTGMERIGARRRR